MVKIVHNLDGNWEDLVGYSKKILVDGEKIGLTGLRVQEVKNPANSKVDKHHHLKQTEIFYFLNTVGNFFVNDELIDLKAGDVLIVEPGDSHYTINNSREDFLYLCFKVGYEGGDMVWEK